MKHSPAEQEKTMNRLLKMTSGGLLAASLAVLPVSGFAQQGNAGTGADTKSAGPAMPSTTATDAKTPLLGAKSEPAAKQTVAAAHAHKHGLAPSSSATKTATPSSTNPTVQPRTVDQSKS
jgi:hypothetical protein